MSEQMPWDRFEPDTPDLPYVPPPQPAPGPPTEPTPPQPEPTPPVPPSADRSDRTDIGDVIAFAVKDALERAAPVLRQEAMDYVRDSIGSIVSGRAVDVLHPTVTATTAAGRELVVADAKSRSGRTFVQGLTIDLIAAVAAVIAVLSGMDPFSGETWIIVGALFVKTIVQTIAAYVMRLKVTPTMRTEGETLAIMPVPRPMLDTDTTQKGQL